VPVASSTTAPRPEAPVSSSAPPWRHEVSVPSPTTPSRRDWPEVLDELGRQLTDGRIHDGDLVALAEALQGALDASRGGG
jgi:hypothetical protein